MCFCPVLHTAVGVLTYPVVWSCSPRNRMTRLWVRGCTQQQVHMRWVKL